MTDAPPRVDESVSTNGDQPATAAKVEAPATVEEPAPVEPAPPPALREPAKDVPVIARKTKEPKPPKPPKEPKVAAPSAAVAAAAAPALATAPPLVVAGDVKLSRHQRKKAARLRARKVKRIVRRVDAWSVLKVSFIFFLCVYVVSMVAILLLWRLATGAGVIDNIESFIEDLGAFETFEFDPDKLFQGAALGGAVLAVLATGLTALGAVLFNLISDLVGGIRMTVIEEPGSRPVVRSKRAKRSGRSPVASDTVSEPSGVISGL